MRQATEEEVEVEDVVEVEISEMETCGVPNKNQLYIYIDNRQV